MIDPENALAPMLMYDLTVYDKVASATTTLHFADREYRSKATDIPASTLFRNRILNAGVLTLDLIAAMANGVAAFGIGTITLANDDGQLDTLRQYIFDGYTAQIYLGTLDASGALTRLPLFAGKMEQPDIGLTVITIPVRSQTYGLDRAILSDRFLGTGGFEGDASLAGVIKPRVYGFVPNVTLIPVDQTNLIYFLASAAGGSDGIQVPSSIVRDEGLALTLQEFGVVASQADLLAFSVTAGNFAIYIDPAGSWIKVGELPAGALTADLGDASTAWTPVVVGDLLTDAGAIESGVSYVGQHYQSGHAPWTGLYVSDDTTTYAQAIATVLAGEAMWMWYSPDTRPGLSSGNFWIIDNLPVDATVSAVGATITDDEILDMVKLGNPKTIGEGVPPWSLTLNYQKNATVQTSGLAPTVSMADRNLYGNEYLKIVSSDTSILAKYPLAQSLVLNTGLIPAGLGFVVQDYADGFFAALSMDRDFYQIKVRLSAKLWTPINALDALTTVLARTPTMSSDPSAGSTAQVLGIVSKRFGLATSGKGTHFWVMALSLDLSAKEVTYVAWTTYRAG